MSSFVTFPGTTGRYAARTDVNLLNADTAHLHQSVGAWVAGADTTAFIHDTGGTPAPPYGSGTAKATTDGTGPLIASLTTPTLTAVEHTVSVDVWSATAGREGFVTFDGTAGTVVALSAGWTRLSATKTVTSGTKAVTVSYRQLDDSAPAAAENVWLARACIRTGTSAVFVPSLRIVGDLDIEIQYADTQSLADIAYLLELQQGGSNGGYAIVLRNDQSRYRIDYTKNDGTTRSVTSGVLTWTDGQVYTMRSTWDVSAGTVKIYRDGVEVSTATNAAYVGGGRYTDATVPPLRIAALNGTSTMFDGDIYYAEVRDGIDGPVAARFSGADVLEAVT